MGSTLSGRRAAAPVIACSGFVEAAGRDVGLDPDDLYERSDRVGASG